MRTLRLNWTVRNLTPEVRAELKRRIDAKVRERIRPYVAPGSACKGCGCSYRYFTVGCISCKARHYRWWKNGKHPNPSYYQRRSAEHTIYMTAGRRAA